MRPAIEVDLPLAGRSPYRLVVRTSRCGRNNPGSTPGEDIVREAYVHIRPWATKLLLLAHNARRFGADLLGRGSDFLVHEATDPATGISGGGKIASGANLGFCKYRSSVASATCMSCRRSKHQTHFPARSFRPIVHNMLSVLDQRPPTHLPSAA